MIELYDKKNIDTLVWPNTADGDYAKRYLLPLIKNGITHYFGNIDAKLYVLKIGELVVPIVSAKSYHNAWVCSTYGYYISFSLESLYLIKNAFKRVATKYALKMLGRFLKSCNINLAVYVNNWFFSTDLYSQDFTPDKVSVIIAFLSKRFPKQAIIFRSINDVTDSPLRLALRKSGCLSIPLRQIYFTDPFAPAIYQRRIIKSDLKLYNECSYTFVEGSQLTESDLSRIYELYKKIYRSSLQPDMKNSFFKLALQNKLFDIQAIKSGDSIIGFSGFFERKGIMMCPIFGYDKDHSEHAKIYRLLSTKLFLDAQKKGVLFHQSAGASQYKKIRGARSCLDYLHVYTHHLTFSQRFAWQRLKNFINTFAVPYMKKY